MICDNKIVELLTGYRPGGCRVQNVGGDWKEYLCDTGEAVCLYDENSGNYHIYPQEEGAQRAIREQLLEFSLKIKNILSNHCNCRKYSQDTKMEDSIVYWEPVWGTSKKLPKIYRCFRFRYQGKISYLNTNRFYVLAGEVFCDINRLQYDCQGPFTMYPDSGEDGAFCVRPTNHIFFNPDDVNFDSDPEKIVESVLRFIYECEH